MGKVKMCPNCKSKKQNPYFCCLKDGIIFCPHCNEKLVETVMDEEDSWTIHHISRDPALLEAMIKLKETDIIEYESRMSQFRSQVEQQKVAKQVAEEKSKTHCPHCNSTEIKSLSMINRGASIAVFGIFSKKINKSFECRKCGYTW